MLDGGALERWYWLRETQHHPWLLTHRDGGAKENVFFVQFSTTSTIIIATAVTRASGSRTTRVISRGHQRRHHSYNRGGQ